MVCKESPKSLFTAFSILISLPGVPKSGSEDHMVQAPLAHTQSKQHRIQYDCIPTLWQELRHIITGAHSDYYNSKKNVFKYQRKWNISWWRNCMK